MAEYAEKLAREAKYLNPPYQEHELVDILAMQFELETYEDLASERVSTVEELAH